MLHGTISGGRCNGILEAAYLKCQQFGSLFNMELQIDKLQEAFDDMIHRRYLCSTVQSLEEKEEA